MKEFLHELNTDQGVALSRSSINDQYTALAHTVRNYLTARWLETGRKHQIRLQLAELGHPVLGDRKYGSEQRFPQGIALHARRLVVQHPTTHAALEFVAPTPTYWPKLPVME